MLQNFFDGLTGYVARYGKFRLVLTICLSYLLVALTWKVTGLLDSDTFVSYVIRLSIDFLILFIMLAFIMSPGGLVDRIRSRSSR